MAPIRCCFDQTAVWHSDAARGPSTPSFNHLVGEQLQRIGHLKAKRPCCLQVDDELELGRLHDRQVRGLRAFENAGGINADLKKHICNIHAVAHQQAGFDHLTVDATRRYSVACRQGRKLDAAADKERVGGDEEGICPVAYHRGEARIDFRAGAGLEYLNLQAQSTRSFWYVSYALGTCDIGRIDQHGNPNGFGHQLMQSPSRLATTSPRKKLIPVRFPPGRARLATRPMLTGFSATPKTTGIVAVAALAASAARLPPGVAITATWRRTRSAISAGKRSYRPSSQWYSTETFWPSM